jgi:hypothetical protein
MPSKLLTLAETSGFRATGRSDEVAALCVAFARTWPHAVRSFEYGRSSEGRAMQALLISRSGAHEAAPLQRRGVPILMIQAGIHPGESDGKDAGFIALREILSAAGPASILDRMAVLFVPAFNVDGHERFGRWNRPNQNGPEQTGWRTTAHNLNLNRDYTKADTPEMRAMLALLREWDPLVCADLHVTDGADFEHDVSIQVEPVNQGDACLRASGVQLRDELIAKLAAQGSLPLPFYPDLARTDDPASGFVLTVFSPRFSTGYFPQLNRFTVLVETHSWKDYATRVRVTRNTILGLSVLVAAHGLEWLAQTREADARAACLGGTEIILDYVSGWREPTRAGAAADEPDTTDAQIIDFRGYAYTRTPSPISGDLVTAYDASTPQIWRVPLRNRVRAARIVTAPIGGYIVPVAYAQELGTKFALHGIAFEPVKTHLPTAIAEIFRATHVEFSATPFEGRMRAQFEGTWRSETLSIGAGALFVPIAQSAARLVMALLEPQAPDSFAAWGFFNSCFEQKEQMEPYVAERIARQMMDSDAALQEAFELKLKHDAVFAADTHARLEFFLRRHVSWDERFNLYPIMRLGTTLPPG